MRIISRNTLIRFWSAHRESEDGLKSWFAKTRNAAWRNSAELKVDFPTADVISRERIVFDIGRRYRLVCAVKFSAAIVWVKFVGTHAAYNKIDAATVDEH